MTTFQKPGYGSGNGDASFTFLFPDPGLLAKLERMSVAGGSRITGTLAGKRRSTSLGGSQEFADYRPYAPGDDVRRIDWNVYGRTGKPFLRQFWDEQELHVHLYIDASESMSGFGGERFNKLTYALRLAASVGYAALCGGDRLSVKRFTADWMDDGLRMATGRASALQLFRYLAKDRVASGAAESTSISGNDFSDLSKPFRGSGSLPRRAGASWLITDAWYERGIEETLLALKSAGQHVVLVQVLSPEELDPKLDGELRLIDAELGTSKEVALSAGSLRNYRDALRAYQEELRRICANKGIPFVSVDTSQPLSDTIARLATIPNTLKL
ncbi:DUF58 domain-containing protein [Paenibacillus sp. LHD-117]|uniref:DUF58 domain-containing protein n=1 Tax=Paenibacillus sp. LHD-117 TaxID=3071412 RepID=UPI0027E1A583|nr:DUF58 domain-containing protein [Paenibacillus sp. LHD-117]MDQ6419149.1 DUF58 domain-containing protein [Paenibacillus sp. LHD-117]